MTWQNLVLRLRRALAMLTERFPLRRVRRAVLVLLASGGIAIVVEALVRAHIASPRDRMPTALYTRLEPWRGGGDQGRAIPIGTLDGRAPDERIAVSLGEVPSHLVQAVIAVEDQRFLQHHGIDLRRIGGALIANLRAGGIAQGGSTLTQQLAKNLFLSAGRTPLRKLREAAMALVLELRYNKRQILEAYLNEIYLGQDGASAIHGVGAAARYYFGKDVERISLAESAELAGMISAPNRTAPTRHPDAARQRRDMVLQLMVDQGRVPRATALQAGRARVSASAHPLVTLDARYFRDFVAATVERTLPARGIAVYTTLDAALQRAAERAIQRGVRRPSLRDAEAALVAIDPRNGDVVAMVGGRDYGVSQFNRATDAHRQPGSAFKPIVALAALERRDGGAPAFTLASRVNDEPLRVVTGGEAWQPTNYDREFRGPVTVREAMEQSLNVPFARIGLAVGPDHIVAAARKLGITSPLHPVPSISLGSSEVTLLELVRAYGVLAAAGNRAAMRTTLGRSDRPEPAGADTGQRVVLVADPAVSYLVTSTLQGVVSRGTGRALNQDGRRGDIAGKTGTSNDWRDAWFVAYSPTLVVGVWVGFDDGRSLQMTGAGAALPIAADFLDQVTPADGWEPFVVPEGVTEGPGGSAEGGSPPDCGSREYFLAGTEPAEAQCSWIEAPGWRAVEDWGQSLARRAERLVAELLGRESRQRRWLRQGHAR